MSTERGGRPARWAPRGRARRVSRWTRLVWPELTPVDAADRADAAARVRLARGRALIDPDNERQRTELVAEAHNRGDLGEALRGLPGVTSPGLLIARRVLSLVWLNVTLVQLTVWALICLIDVRFAYPFPLWTGVIGGLFVGGLWWVTESEYRRRPLLRSWFQGSAGRARAG